MAESPSCDSEDDLIPLSSLNRKKEGQSTSKSTEAQAYDKYVKSQSDMFKANSAPQQSTAANRLEKDSLLQLQSQNRELQKTLEAEIGRTEV